MVKRLCYVSFPAHKETGADDRTNEGIRVDGGFVNSSGSGWKKKMSKRLKVYRRGLMTRRLSRKEASVEEERM